MSELKDYLPKVSALTTVKKSFKPEGETDAIDYYQVIVHVRIDGDDEQITLKAKKSDIQLLRAADNLATKTILDDDEDEV